ncbi:uncharacterized protein V6R79_024468 [Siganus canaliculatus]
MNTLRFKVQGIFILPTGRFSEQAAAIPKTICDKNSVSEDDSSGCGDAASTPCTGNPGATLKDVKERLEQGFLRSKSSFFPGFKFRDEQEEGSDISFVRLQNFYPEWVCSAFCERRQCPDLHLKLGEFSNVCSEEKQKFRRNESKEHHQLTRYDKIVGSVRFQFRHTSTLFGFITQSSNKSRLHSGSGLFSVGPFRIGRSERTREDLPGYEPEVKRLDSSVSYLQPCVLQ